MKKLIIVGAGKMGGSVLVGALKSGLLKTEEIGIYESDVVRTKASKGIWVLRR
ncbi:MAG: hypothetical protein R2880_09245 [Deinococcales bacterium]